MWSFRKVVFIVAWTALGSWACQVELQHELNEIDANEVIVLLESNGIKAEKTRDLENAGWMVLVSDSDRGRAWRVMQEAGLPRRSAHGFESLYPRSGLLPSPDEERVLLQAATAGEMERTLQRLEGVIDARVHLVLAPKSRLKPPGHADQHAKASVLMIVKTEYSSMDPKKVSTLVSGGVHGLDPKDVQVIIDTAVTSSSKQPPPVLVELGPFSVSATSIGPLRVFLSLLMLLVVIASCALIMTLFKLRRLRMRTAA